MPKNLTAAMRAHLDEETTRLAAIWRITRKDGQQFFFTDHDRDIVFAGDTYRADAGFERTAIRSDAGFAVDNLDLVGVFAEGGIVEDEVRAGLFDGAGIALAFVNWQDPDSCGEIKLRRGTLGEVRLTPQGHFTAELRGLSQPLAQSTLQIYGPACRADLGDHRCRFPIKPPVLGREQAVQPGAFYRVGRDLIPYAPAHLTLAGEVGGGSDIEVTWVRRTRVTEPFDVGLHLPDLSTAGARCSRRSPWRGP